MFSQSVGIRPLLYRHAVVLLLLAEGCAAASGSASPPAVAQIDINNSTVVLQCESKGWYPEPELLWLDAEGKLLSAGPTETVRGPDVLYTVSSTVTVETRHNSSFTCREKTVNQTRDTQIQIQAECPPTSCYTARLGIILVVALTWICAASFVMWKRNQQKARETESQQEEREEEHREWLLATSKKIEDLEEEKTKLDQELKKREEEQKDLEQVDKTVMEQEKEIHKLCEVIKRQKDELLKVKDDFSKKLVSVDEETGSDRANGFIQLQTILSNTRKHLEQVQEGRELLYEDTVKLLEKAEGMLKTLTDKKTEEEKHKEKIQERLEQVEKQRAEAQEES